MTFIKIIPLIWTWWLLKTTEHTANQREKTLTCDGWKMFVKRSGFPEYIFGIVVWGLFIGLGFVFKDLLVKGGII